MSMGILGNMAIPIRTGILVRMCNSRLGLVSPLPSLLHQSCSTLSAELDTGRKSPPTGFMSKTPSFAKVLLKTLPSSKAPGLTAMKIPLMITVTF